MTGIVSDFRPQGRGRRRTFTRDITPAEHDAMQDIAPRLYKCQVMFDSGKHKKACSALMSLALSFGISDRDSTYLRLIETGQVIRRARNGFDGEWDKSHEDYYALVNIRNFMLFDDVLISVLLDMYGYPYRDIYRVAPGSGDGWMQAGEFRPGYGEEDERIRFSRLRALAREYAADHNLSREETDALLSRCYPTIDRDDDGTRFNRFCCVSEILL